MTVEERNRITFVIADTTYARGYHATEAIKAKQLKYRPLMDALRLYGFKVTGFAQSTCATAVSRDDTAEQHPNDTPSLDCGVLVLGTTGEVYESNKHVLAAFELKHAVTTSLLRTFHTIAIRSALSMLSTRRKMDKGMYNVNNPNAQQPHGTANMQTMKRKTSSKPVTQKKRQQRHQGASGKGTGDYG